MINLRPAVLDEAIVLVSIIVPCFNYGWVLSETLDSLLAQTYVNWECIIVDDGSTDDTRVIAERYQQQDDRFSYVHQLNAGLSAARNTGLTLAKGKYVQLLDADDLLVARKLETQVAYLETHPAVDVVYGDVRYFLHGVLSKFSRSINMLDEPWMVNRSDQGDKYQLLHALVRANIMVVNAPLIRNSLMHTVGLFDERLRSLEDWGYWLRCALAGAQMHYDATPNAWALVRVHTASMSQNNLRMCANEMFVRQELHASLENVQATEAIQINKRGMQLINEAVSDIARRNIIKGDVLAGMKQYIKLAQQTGRYSYYLRSGIYWLRVRLLSVPEKN